MNFTDDIIFLFILFLQMAFCFYSVYYYLQFFASKKKRPISPSLKAEIPDKDAKGALDGSPSAKGTLDSYLVNSDHDNCLVKPAYEDCGGASKHDPVKRNLTLEINLTSEVINRSTSPLNNCEGLEHSEQAGVVGNVQQLAPCKISDELSSSHDACDISTEVRGKETVSSASGAQNLELRQFAADFLSLYCRQNYSKLNKYKLVVYKYASLASYMEVIAVAHIRLSVLVHRLLACRFIIKTALLDGHSHVLEDW